jgi:hypothetical protein
MRIARPTPWSVFSRPAGTMLLDFVLRRIFSDFAAHLDREPL